jgi:hypothetical protein
VSGSTHVFVSYRREDTRHVAGRLADRLVERFHVFMDMDTIEPGTDFTDVIQRAVNDCDVFLSIIGSQWTTAADEHGRRRLDDPDDWVVAEIAAALRRRVPVIPVLVDGARMPTRAELPATLAPLASRQAMTLRHESFSSDVGRLITTIEKRLGTSAAAVRSDQQVTQVNPAAVEADYTAALAGYFGQRWDQAIEGFQRVLSQQPNHQAAADRLAEARRHQQLATWNSQADRAAAEGRWSDAVVLLENIRSLDPDYPDLSRRLQAATRKRNAADLEADIRTLAAAGQWAAVAAAGQELATIDPSRANPDGLVTRAQAALAESTRQHTAWPQSQPTPPQTPTFGRPLIQPAGPPGPPGQLAPGVTVPPPKRKRFPAWVVALIAVGVVLVVALGVLLVRSIQNGARAAPDISASPSVTVPSATPTPSSSGKSLTTSNLRTHIPTDIRTTCTDYTPPAGDALEAKLVGAVRCELTGAGVPDKVWYFEFPDNSAMDTAYAAYIRGDFTKGDCTKNRQKMDYTTTEKGKKLPGGLLHCYNADGDVTFAWTHDYLHIVSFASDPDLSFAEMKKWWEHAGPYREP